MTETLGTHKCIVCNGDMVSSLWDSGTLLCAERSTHEGLSYSVNIFGNRKEYCFLSSDYGFVTPSGVTIPKSLYLVKSGNGSWSAKLVSKYMGQRSAAMTAILGSGKVIRDKQEYLNLPDDFVITLESVTDLLK